MKSQLETIDAICCPEFDPTLWDDKLFVWKNKKFIKDNVFTLFYMPINFGFVMKRVAKKVTQAGSEMPSDGLCLSDHTSKWNYVAIMAQVE